jgi:Las1-like
MIYFIKAAYHLSATGKNLRVPFEIFMIFAAYNDKINFVRFSRFEFEEIYDLLFSSNIKIEKAYETLNIWKIRLAENTPTGVVCTLEILEAQIHDSKAPSKTDQFDVIVSYSNAITRFFNFLTSLKHDTDDNVSGMKSVAEAIGIPDYVIDLRVSISHTKQPPSLEVLRRAAKHSLEFIKRKYWDIELVHIREAQLNTIQSQKVTILPTREKEPTKSEKRNSQLQLKNKQLLELQLAIYDFVVELGQKYEVKKNKDLAGKHFILPAAQLETMKSYFNGKKLAKEENLFAHYEAIMIDDIESTLQLCNDDGVLLTEAIFNRCGFFKEAAGEPKTAFY